MSDIFNDIDEDLRRENLKQMGRKALPWVSALCVALVLGAAAWSGYEWYNTSKSGEASVKYQAALDLAQQGKFTEADTVFMELSHQGPKGYATLSRFRHASINAIVEPSRAYEQFDVLADDKALSKDLQDLARIRSAQILLDQGQYSDIESRIQALAENPSSTWRHAAREILALAAWKAGNEEQARRWGEMVLSDFSAPAGTRGRAQLVLDILGDTPPGAASNRKATREDAGSPSQPSSTPAPAQAAQP